MIPLATRFCVGCGQVLDEMQPSDSRPRWIAAWAYREKYGLRLNDLHLIEDAYPPCGRVFVIGRGISLPETSGTSVST